MGETLGCQIEEVETLAEAGFDFFYNSSKWWDFDEPWCLEQHERFGRFAPSTSFPESHDTERLAAACSRASTRSTSRAAACTRSSRASRAVSTSL